MTKKSGKKFGPLGEAVEVQGEVGIEKFGIKHGKNAVKVREVDRDE